MLQPGTEVTSSSVFGDGKTLEVPVVLGGVAPRRCCWMSSRRCFRSGTHTALCPQLELDPLAEGLVVTRSRFEASTSIRLPCAGRSWYAVLLLVHRGEGSLYLGRRRPICPVSFRRSRWVACGSVDRANATVHHLEIASRELLRDSGNFPKRRSDDNSKRVP